MKSFNQRVFIAAILVLALLSNSVAAFAQDGNDLVGGASGDIAGGSSVFVFRVSRRKSHDRSAFRTASFSRTAQARVETRRQRFQQSRLTAPNRVVRPTVVPKAGKVEEMEKMQAAVRILGAAKQYLEEKDLDEAEKGFREVRAIDPTNAEAGFGLGKIYIARGDQFFDQKNYPKAAGYYIQASDFDALNADAYAGLGDAYDALNQPDKALPAYEKALELNPGLTALAAPLGALYYQAGNYEKSEQYLKKALAANPDDTKLRDLYGLVLYRLGRDEEALAALEKAVAANQTNATTFYYLGEVYDRLNRQADAVGAYRKTLEIDKSFVEAYYDLGVAYYNRADYPEAAKNYERAIALKGDYVEARLNLADTYRLMEKYADAINQYQVLVLGFLPRMSDKQKQEIKEAEVYSKFGFCLTKNNQANRAVEFMQKAVDKQPDAVNYTNLAWAYNSDKNYQAAQQAAEKAVTLDQNFAAAYYNLGNAQARSNDHQNAVKSFEKALKLRQNWAEALNNLGVSYGSLGNWDKAVEAHRAAVKADPASAEARYNLGVAELNDNNRAAAERERDALVSMNAGFAQKLAALIKVAPTSGDKDKKKKDKKKDKKN